MKEQKMIRKSNQKSKTWKIILIVFGGVLGVLFVAYAIFLTVFDAWNEFGEPFWFENGNLYFRERNCCEGERRKCGPSPNYLVCYCLSEDTIIELKPIIYLYPEKETELEVKLGKPEDLTVSYPKYEDGWKVIASPNGDLVDRKTGNKMYALYWEGENNDFETDYSTGFVAEGEKSAEFLEEKLEILGLNYKEKEEFITYWLPKMEKNKYNYIYFLTENEIEKGMPIEVSENPETVIRVRMAFKGLDEKIEVREQKLEKAPGRNGFTMVEWGGIEL